MEVFRRGFWIGLVTFVVFQIGFFATQKLLGINSDFWREFGWDYLIPVVSVIILEVVYLKFNPLNRSYIIAGVAFIFALLLIFLANVWMRSLG